MASSLLVASHNRTCLPQEGLAGPFAAEVLSHLLEGHWQLGGTQWVLYVRKMVQTLQACEPQSPAQFFPGASPVQIYEQARRLTGLVQSITEGLSQDRSMRITGMVALAGALVVKVKRFPRAKSVMKSSSQSRLYSLSNLPHPGLEEKEKGSIF
ncbi:hypothetical protein MYX65_07930 [Acidobacteria bacterium AH-259-L09]|nr:hypothetical protein [Acidobacteria bacterium AH-259-L09]